MNLIIIIECNCGVILNEVDFGKTIPTKEEIQNEIFSIRCDSCQDEYEKQSTLEALEYAEQVENARIHAIGDPSR